MSNAKRKKLPVSGIVICFFFLVPIAWRQSPLEFANARVELFFNRFFLLGCFISVLLSVMLIIKAVEKLDAITGVMIIVGFLGFLLIAALFAVFSAGMCGYTTREVLYIQDNGDKIVVREFGCGATDSTSPTVSVAKISFFTPWFISVQSIDTTRIDRTKWRRVINESGK